MGSEFLGVKRCLACAAWRVILGVAAMVEQPPARSPWCSLTSRGQPGYWARLGGTLTVFLLLQCNDKEVLGPWVNKPWLNAVATVILGVLFMLSPRSSS